MSNSPQPSTIASQSGGDSQPAPQETKNSIEKTNTAANAPVSIQTPNTVVPNNIVAESLKQIGATRCMSRANDLSRAISGTTESVVLQKPFGDPDASLLSVMLLPTAASKVTGASILSLAPNQSNGCGAVFQSIDIIEKPCASALPEIFGPNRATPVGTNGFAVVALNSSARVLAIPSSNTCVLVKQEYVL